MLKFRKLKLDLVVGLVLVGLVSIGLISEPKAVDADVNIEFIKIASDNWHFETKNLKQPFVPFGCNYYDPATILNPFTGFGVISKFDAVRTDRHFAQLESIGVNIVKINLSVISFEPEFKQLNEANFQKVDKIIELAKKHNIRLIFQLFDYWEGGPSHTCGEGPCVPWLNSAIYTDEQTLEGLKFLDSAFAKRYANEPTIFAWELKTEPTILWDHCLMKAKWQDWVYAKYSNESNLRNEWSDYPNSDENWNNIQIPEDKNSLNNQRIFDYQRFREDIAYNWVKILSDAIRKEDKNHFIAVSNLPWVAPFVPTKLIDPAGTENFSKPSLYPAFNPNRLSPFLDYLSIDVYNWWDSDVEKYIKGTLRYSYVENKPFLINEFSYSDSIIDETLDSASGWLSWACYGADGFDWPDYFFDSNEQITNLGIAFQNKAPSIKDQVLARSPDLEVISLDMKKLLTDIDEQDNIYTEYIQKCETTEDCRIGFASICYSDGTKSITGECDASCGASATCNGIMPGICSTNSLKKCGHNCQEVSSCGDGICNCGETSFNCSNDCHGKGKVVSMNIINTNPKVGDTVEINYIVENIGDEDIITVLCGFGYLPEQYILSQYLQEKTYTLQNGEQKTDSYSFVMGEDLYQEQQNGKDVIGIAASFHGEPKIWDQTKYEDITVSPLSLFCSFFGFPCFINSDCCSNICNKNCCQQSCLIDDWYNTGNSYACCDGNNKCACQNQEYRDYYCDTNGECAYSITNTRTIKSDCQFDDICQSNNNISDGTLIKTPDSFKIYIIINQKKKWIPSLSIKKRNGFLLQRSLKHWVINGQT
jgi:hypothetical protein